MAAAKKKSKKNTKLAPTLQGDEESVTSTVTRDSDVVCDSEVSGCIMEEEGE